MAAAGPAETALEVADMSFSRSSRCNRILTKPEAVVQTSAGTAEEARHAPEMAVSESKGSGVVRAVMGRGSLAPRAGQ